MAQASQERAAESKPIVLFLDDNLDTLELYEAYFGRNGYSVLTSSRGVNAIRLAEAHPDWVLGPPERRPVEWRHQQVLDVANPAVSDPSAHHCAFY